MPSDLLTGIHIGRSQHWDIDLCSGRVFTYGYKILFPMNVK